MQWLGQVELNAYWSVSVCIKFTVFALGPQYTNLLQAQQLWLSFPSFWDELLLQSLPAASLDQNNKACDKSRSLCVLAAVAFHLESITSLQPLAFIRARALSSAAAHLNALDGINDEISPVCPGQNIKGPLKVDSPGCPRIHLAHHMKQWVGNKQVRVSRVMWVKIQIKSQLSH